MPKRKSKSSPDDDWQKLQRRIVRCRKCPRLIEHCKAIAVKKRKAYADQKYWGKPVENFGHRTSRLLVMGLAPGAHGANRTGRMFTGDRSGDWLYRAMHKSGFASQADSIDREDGLELVDAVVSGVCHCAPPDNKPTREEITNCQPFLEQTVLSVEPTVAKATQWLSKTDPKPPKFCHGAEHQFANKVWLLASYHPSQQNTFTGRLTEAMFDRVFKRARKLCDR